MNQGKKYDSLALAHFSVCFCVNASEVSQGSRMIRREKKCARERKEKNEPLRLFTQLFHLIESALELQKSTAQSTTGISHVRSTMTNSQTCPIADHCVGEMTSDILLRYQRTADSYVRQRLPVFRAAERSCLCLIDA